MCNKIRFRIECLKCDYPYSEALYPDADQPLSCNASDKRLKQHIKTIIIYKIDKRGNISYGQPNTNR